MKRAFIAMALCAGNFFSTAYPVNANSSNWFEFFAEYVMKKGKDTFEVMTLEGLILSRLTKNYAAFSFGTTRLSAANRLSEPVDVSEFNFVVGFGVCPGSDDYFDGAVYQVDFRYHTEVADTLIKEILDINEFINRDLVNIQPVVKSSTEDELVTIYMIGDGAELRYTLSREKHYIELMLTVEGVCELNSN